MSADKLEQQKRLQNWLNGTKNALDSPVLAQISCCALGLPFNQTSEMIEDMYQNWVSNYVSHTFHIHFKYEKHQHPSTSINHRPVRYESCA
jgi:hypothetical protein